MLKFFPNSRPIGTCPEYRTVFLGGGFGDCLYNILRGEFAHRGGHRIFVMEDCHLPNIRELLANCPQVAGVATGQYAIAFTPLAGEEAFTPLRLDFPEERLSVKYERYAIIHPYSSDDRKDLARIVNLRQVCLTVQAWGLVPILVGKSCEYLADHEYLRPKKEFADIPGVVNLIDKTTVSQLVELVAHSSCVIGSHSSVAMIGWSTSKPTFCVLPDTYFCYHVGRLPVAWFMYLEPLFRQKNGFLFQSHAHCLDRFLDHFLTKNFGPVVESRHSTLKMCRLRACGCESRRGYSETLQPVEFGVGSAYENVRLPEPDHQKPPRRKADHVLRLRRDRLRLLPSRSRPQLHSVGRSQAVEGQEVEVRTHPKFH